MITNSNVNRDCGVRLLCLREAAAALGVSERKLWGIPQDELPRVRFGRSVRFDVADLREWIQERKQMQG